MGIESETGLLAAYERYRARLGADGDSGWDAPARLPAKLDDEYMTFVALGQHVINDREAAELGALVRGNPDPRARYLETVATARFNAFADPGFGRVNLLTIGANCLPHLLLTKWGLRRSKASGGGTMPLDLLYALDDGALETVIGGFEGMTDPARLSLNEEWQWVRNLPMGLVFNHENGPEWRENGHALLRERYDRRVAAFKAAQANGKPSIYIFVSHTEFTPQTRDLALRAAESLGGSLLCVITQKCEPEMGNHTVMHAGHRIDFLRNPVPFSDYQFYNPAHYPTLEGLRHEQLIVEAIETLAASV